MFERIDNWWRRPCGGRDVVILALPLVISTMSFTVMTFIDRMFLTWYSINDVAAAMPAGMLQFTLISFPLGVATYVNTFVAQYEGSGRPRQIGPIVWQGIWIGLTAIPLLLLTAPLAQFTSSTRATTRKSSSKNRPTMRADIRLRGDHSGRHAFLVLHRPRGDAGGDGRRLHGRGAQRRAGLAVDLRSLRILPRRHCRRRRGHRLRNGSACSATRRSCCCREYRKYRLASGWRWNAASGPQALDFRRAGRLAVFVECGSFTLFITLVAGWAN